MNNTVGMEWIICLSIIVGALGATIGLTLGTRCVLRRNQKNLQKRLDRMKAELQVGSTNKYTRLRGLEALSRMDRKADR